MISYRNRVLSVKKHDILCWCSCTYCTQCLRVRTHPIKPIIIIGANTHPAKRTRIHTTIRIIWHTPTLSHVSIMCAHGRTACHRRSAITTVVGQHSELSAHNRRQQQTMRNNNREQQQQRAKQNTYGDRMCVCEFAEMFHIMHPVAVGIV